MARAAILRVSPVAICLLLYLLVSGASVGKVQAAPDQPDVPTAPTFTIRFNPPSCEEPALEQWTAEAEEAMRHVVDILDDLLVYDGEIVVDACFAQQEEGVLASASPTDFVTECNNNVVFPVDGSAYPMPLANALCGADQNGDTSEIMATANSTVAWEFCTTNCTWPDPASTDFVSTMVHEMLHGLGFLDDFLFEDGVGSVNAPESVFTRFIICSGNHDGVCLDGQRLIDLPDQSEQLGNAIQLGSGNIAFAGPNAKAAFGQDAGPFLYAPNPYESGSNLAHWDDNHVTNVGRMMNAATDSGPSSRVVDGITLMVLKDIGWTVLEAGDVGNSSMDGYGVARHLNQTNVVGFTMLGSALAVDDGIVRVGTWADGVDGGAIEWTVTGAGSCLSAWVDWNGNQSLDDDGDQIFSMQAVAAGSGMVAFAIPDGTFPGSGGNLTFNARFRLVPDWDGDGVCTQIAEGSESEQVPVPSASIVFGGEVEEYQWTFTASGEPVSPALYQQFLPVVLGQ